MKHFKFGDKIVLAIAVLMLVAFLTYINFSVRWALDFASFEYLAGAATAAGVIWLAYVALKWLETRLGQ